MDPVICDKPIASAESDVAALRVSVFVRPAIFEKTGKARGRSVWKILGISVSRSDKFHSNFFHSVEVLA